MLSQFYVWNSFIAILQNVGTAVTALPFHW
jgi:hypothetical protein